jgi:DNA-binding Lrp family transcriptional regulator
MSSEDGYTDVPTHILLDGSLSIGARTTYMLILSHNGHINQGQLAAEAGVGSKTIRAYLNELRNRGLINGRTGYVYVIEMAGFYKIGSARNVENRLQGHQTSTPFDVTLVVSGKVEDCVDVERELQRQYKHRHVRNEWFRLTPEDLNEIRARLESADA